MFGIKYGKSQNCIDSLIGAETKITGVVQFSGKLLVNGVIDGCIIANHGKTGILVLGEHALVDGEIKVTHLSVNGTLTGQVYVADHLELQRKARLRGDVYYKTLEIEFGAIIDGVLTHFSDGMKWLR